MIKLENYETMGWEHAIRGMRNPMNSWEKGDSMLCKDRATCDHCYFEGNVYGDKKTYPISCDEALGKAPKFSIGPNDHKLMMNLRNAGTDHRKYLRMITVYVDITAPLYWWKEFDTYKVGTVANSCSTMHKIHEKEFTLEDFSCEHLIDERHQLMDDIDEYCEKNNIAHYMYGPLDDLKYDIDKLNVYRMLFLQTKNKDWWWQIIQRLPSSYNQKRTVMLNYEVLANMYKSRKAHKLDEWIEFCKWIESLPYSEIITGGKEHGD